VGEEERPQTAYCPHSPSQRQAESRSLALGVIPTISNAAAVSPERLALSDLSKEQRFRKVGDIAVGLLKVQRSFIDKDKFVIMDKVGNVNGKALGYIFGMLDALLQCVNLDIRDIEGEAALHSVIALMFPTAVLDVGTYFGRLKNIENALEITIGIMLGRKQTADWLRHKTPPVRWTTCFSV
jgi:hypothetical protein